LRLGELSTSLSPPFISLLFGLRSCERFGDGPAVRFDCHRFAHDLSFDQPSRFSSFPFFVRWIVSPPFFLSETQFALSNMGWPNRCFLLVLDANPGSLSLQLLLSPRSFFPLLRSPPDSQGAALSRLGWVWPGPFSPPRRRCRLSSDVRI